MLCYMIKVKKMKKILEWTKKVYNFREIEVLKIPKKSEIWRKSLSLMAKIIDVCKQIQFSM